MDLITSVVSLEFDLSLGGVFVYVQTLDQVLLQHELSNFCTKVLTSVVFNNDVQYFITKFCSSHCVFYYEFGKCALCIVRCTYC